jgi:biopolymer transport protein ExbB/TolQ
MPQLNPGDYQAAGQFVEWLTAATKWAIGVGAAAWVVLKLGAVALMRLGTETHKYQEVVTDVAKLKEDYRKLPDTFMTIKDHEKIQIICRSDVDLQISNKNHQLALALLDKMEIINANVYRLMLAKGLTPVVDSEHKRTTDQA